MSTHIVRPTATNICQKPLPSTKVMAMTSNTVGMDHTTLMSHMMTLSTQPPR